MTELAMAQIYPTDENVPGGMSARSTPTATPRSKKRRSSHVPEVLVPEVTEGDDDLETATSPRRIFSDEQRKLLSKLAVVDEHRYSVGVVVMLVNAGIVLRCPQFYWMVYAVQACILFVWRFFRFRRTNEELLLLDFCYWVTLLAVVWISMALLRENDIIGENVFTKHDALIFRALFSFANGALAWSVVIFNNRAVFHHVDHMTSTFTHLSPALFTYTLRWGSGFGPGKIRQTWSNTFRICDLNGGGDSYDKTDECVLNQFFCAAECEASARDIIGIPSLIYLAWVVPYFLLLFVFFRKCIESNKKETLYSFMLGDRAMQKFILLAPESPYLLRPLVYIGSHFALVVALSTSSLLLWNSFYLHTLLLCLLGIVVIKNSANWIFHYFALRYAEGLLQEHAEQISKQNQNQNQNQNLNQNMNTFQEEFEDGKERKEGDDQSTLGENSTEGTDQYAIELVVDKSVNMVDEKFEKPKSKKGTSLDLNPLPSLIPGSQLQTNRNNTKLPPIEKRK